MFQPPRLRIKIDYSRQNPPLLPFLPCPQVVLLAPEAKNPAKHVPRALFASLFAVAVVCAMASASLSGALAAPDLDPDSAFAEVFRARGMMVAYKVYINLLLCVSVNQIFCHQRLYVRQHDFFFGIGTTGLPATLGLPVSALLATVKLLD